MGDHEVVQVLDFREGARYERLQRDVAGVAVDVQREAERVVDPSPEILVGGFDRAVEVRYGVDDRAGLVDADDAALAFAGRESGQVHLDLVAFGLERVDPVADQRGLDAGFDCRDLALEAPVDVGELFGESLALVLVGVAEVALEIGLLCLEVDEAVGAEDVVGEEAVHELGQDVLADVLPLAVADSGGRAVAVVDAVAAGVVDVVLAGLALHP